MHHVEGGPENLCGWVGLQDHSTHLIVGFKSFLDVGALGMCRLWGCGLSVLLEVRRSNCFVPGWATATPEA